MSCEKYLDHLSPVLAPSGPAHVALPVQPCFVLGSHSDGESWWVPAGPWSSVPLYLTSFSRVHYLPKGLGVGELQKHQDPLK